MKYENIKEGIFIDRPNRFVAKVIIDGEEDNVHVKNTGRCKELLESGTKVYLEDFHGRMKNRKMRYSLITTVKPSNKMIINMDSQAPNRVVEEGLKSKNIILPKMYNLVKIQREKKYDNSRFDFYVEDEKGQKAFIEVKGVTLENNNVAYFPDAPTERGVKHIKELIKATKEGYKSYIIFVVQIDDIKLFRPNYNTQPEFGKTLIEASKNGVEILAYNCKVTPDTLNINSQIEIDLYEK